jgi:hypothetical protein
MDHLPAVIGGSDLVPYMGITGWTYSQEGFLEFPQQYGQDYQQLIDQGHLTLDPEAHSSFVQAWLFFALLGEFSHD